MINFLRFLTVGLIAKLLHCAHIGWYSTRVTYVLVGEYKIDVFDTFLMVTVGVFLLYMVIKSPDLDGKAKKAYLMIKVVFHAISIIYICWEGLHTHNYVRMGAGLVLYGLIELVIIIIHDINKSGPPPKGNMIAFDANEIK